MSHQLELRSLNPKKKITYLSISLAILFIGILTLQFLNFSGFCYSEFRYLSERELVKNFLFGADNSESSEIILAQKLKETRGGEFPSCCRVDGEPWSLSLGDKILNKIAGRYFYLIRTNFPNSHVQGDEDSYVITDYSVDACGIKSYDSSSEFITEPVYKAHLKSTDNYWDSIE